MAHHIFRRCLLADVVPPVPPPVAEGGDYRLVVSPELWLVIPVANGVEFGTSVVGLDVMSQVLVKPIPPGIDTGLGYYRLNVGTVGVEIGIVGVEINGGYAAGGIAV